MCKDCNEPGCVYILKDDHFKRGVKIGRAQNVAQRMRSLVTANPWLSVYVKIRTTKWIELEKATHNIIKLVAKRKQVKNSEFYLIEPEKAKHIMLEFARLIDRDDFQISAGDGSEVEPKTIGENVKKKCARTEPTKQKQANFSFAAVGIPIGSVLQFTLDSLGVNVADEKNKVVFKGKTYSLSGFVRAFHPHPNKAGAYQGPKFFTYNGVLLTDLRKQKEECEGAVSQVKDSLVHRVWKNPTQLARHLALQGGNIKAAGGIFLQLTGKRRVVKTSKWRVPMETVGVKFDEKDMVVGW